MKQNIFVTSDQHWGHERIIEYAKRPFSSVETMDAALVYNWNYVVSDNDTIIALGDMFVGCSEAHIEEILNQLHFKHLIYVRGNHCSVRRLVRIKEILGDRVEIKDIHYQNYGGLFFICSHFNIDNPEWRIMAKQNSEVCSLFGHVHNNVPHADLERKVFNCCVEVTDYTPVSLSKIFHTVKNDFVAKGVWNESAGN